MEDINRIEKLLLENWHFNAPEHYNYEGEIESIRVDAKIYQFDTTVYDAATFIYDHNLQAKEKVQAIKDRFKDCGDDAKKLFQNLIDEVFAATKI